VLTRPRDRARLTRDVADMREKLAAAKPARSPWAVKYVRGGLVDIEFICQHLQLAHASDEPDILSPTTGVALRRMQLAGLLPADDAETLIGASNLMLSLQQVMRLCVEGDFDAAAATPGLRDLLLRASPAASLEDLEALLAARQREALAIFNRSIG